MKQNLSIISSGYTLGVALIFALWQSTTASAAINCTASSNPDCTGSITVSGTDDQSFPEGEIWVYVVNNRVSGDNWYLVNSGNWGDSTAIQVQQGVNVLTVGDNLGSPLFTVYVPSGGANGGPAISYAQGAKFPANPPYTGNCGFNIPITINCLATNTVYHNYETWTADHSNVWCFANINVANTQDSSDGSGNLVLPDKSSVGCPTAAGYPSDCDVTYTVTYHIAPSNPLKPVPDPADIATAASDRIKNFRVAAPRLSEGVSSSSMTTPTTTVSFP
jgi:hypothetical protein